MGTAQSATMFLPTKEACEDYRLRRFHTDYDDLTSADGQVGANSGFVQDALLRLGQLSENAIGVDIPGLGPPGIEDQRVFLAGPQFKNKAQNIIQDVVAQYTLGLYNGPTSAFWNSKRGQNQPASSQDELAKARTTNSVWVYAKKNTPFKVKVNPTTVNGQSINVTEYDYGGGKQESEIVWKMNILPNWNQDEGLEFSHDHEWGKASDMFSSLLSTVGDIIGGASRVIQGVRDAKNGLAGNDANQARSTIQPDIADTYQKTNRMEVTIPFTLFTRNHFYRDILAPIMILNFLSFPRRRKLEEAAKELNDIAASVIKGASALPGGESLGKINTENPVGDAEKFLNSVIPGFRIFALEPPSYFNIEHSSGLFSFKNCAVTNFSYKYMGPWVTTTNHPQDQSVGENPDGGSNVVRAPKKDFWKFWKTETNIADETWTKAKLTYPLRVDCQITFRLIDPLFADDFLNQLRNYQDAWNTESAGFSFDSASGKPGTDILNLGGLI